MTCLILTISKILKCFVFRSLLWFAYYVAMETVIFSVGKRDWIALNYLYLPNSFSRKIPIKDNKFQNYLRYSFDNEKII